MQRDPGCLLCHCLKVFEAAESVKTLCECGHTAAKHDRYCAHPGCRNVARVGHQLCREHE